MRKHICIFGVVLVCLMSFACGQRKAHEEPSGVGKLQHLSVNGTALVNECGDTVVLRGVSLGWHNWWGDFYNSKCIGHLAGDWNARVIRAAIGVEPDGAYLTDSVYAMSCLTNVIDAAIDNGIYVIADWHSHGIHTEAAKVFFRTVATKYRGVPNVIYELYNEPVDVSWEEVRDYAVEIIRTIRSVDNSAVIIVGSPHWDQDVHLAADAPIEGFDNIMYSLHFYAGTHKQWLRERADYAIGKGLPVFVSECAGMNADGDGPIDYDEWQKWVDWMDTHSLSRVMWSVSAKDETCSMIAVGGPCDGSWSESDIKEWGGAVIKELKK